MDETSAFVLAGGRSSRMGTDKAMLRFGEQSLLERMLACVQQVCPIVKIVGPRRLYGSFGEAIEDVHPGCGPLGGIHAALSNTSAELNLVVSVDMPLMQPSFLEWLMRQASASDSWCVVPEAMATLQPLCAVYRRKLAANMEEALTTGDYKISHMLEQVPTHYIGEEQIRSAGFAPEIFRNVNTKEEFASALKGADLRARTRATITL